MGDEIVTRDSIGKKAVSRYDGSIRKNAEKYNIDPDLVRSIMYVENARGHKLGLNDLADKIGFSDSIMPMNIQKDKWSKLVGKNPDDMYNPDTNIEAATVLLKRIMDRIEKPTPEKIGSIWNSASKEKTSKFGEYVRQVYDEKPWKK